MGGPFPKWETAILGVALVLRARRQNPNLSARIAEKIRRPASFQWSFGGRLVPRRRLSTRPKSFPASGVEQ